MLCDHVVQYYSHYYKVLCQYHSVLQSTTPVLPSTTPENTKHHRKHTNQKLKNTTTNTPSTFYARHLLHQTPCTPNTLTYVPLPTPLQLSRSSPQRHATTYLHCKWGYFARSPEAFSIIKYNVLHPILQSKLSPNTAPATKSDTTTSPNTAPATKSATWTSPSTAPATKSDTWTSPSSAPATKSDTCAEQQVSRSNRSKILRLSRKKTHILVRITYETSFTVRGATGVTIQPHQILHLSRRKHRILSPHHIWKRHLQCAEQQVSPSNLTKYCTCHEKWLDCCIVLTYETSFPMRGATGVTIQPPQILRLPRKMTLQDVKENLQKQVKRHFQCGADPTMIRPWSDHDPRMIREWSENENANRNPPRKWGYFARSPEAFSIVEGSLNRNFRQYGELKSSSRVIKSVDRRCNSQKVRRKDDTHAPNVREVTKCCVFS